MFWKQSKLHQNQKKTFVQKNKEASSGVEYVPKNQVSGKEEDMKQKNESEKKIEKQEEKLEVKKEEEVENGQADDSY